MVSNVVGGVICLQRASGPGPACSSEVNKPAAVLVRRLRSRCQAKFGEKKNSARENRWQDCCKCLSDGNLRLIERPPCNAQGNPLALPKCNVMQPKVCIEASSQRPLLLGPISKKTPGRRNPRAGWRDAGGDLGLPGGRIKRCQFTAGQSPKEAESRCLRC